MTAAAARRPARLLRALTAIGWYPLCLALAWFLEVWISARVDPAAAVRGLVITAAIALLLTILLTLALGRERGALMAAIAVLIALAASTAVVVIPFAAAISLLLIERRWADARRIRLPWARIHEALTVVAAIMLLFQVGRAATVTPPAPLVDRNAWAADQPTSHDPPNMYVILADGHGRPDILRAWYGYDAATFVDALGAEGFEVAAASRANYMATRFSLASMFTGTYLDAIHDGSADADQRAAATIRDNPMFPLLRRAGYEVVVVSSGYEHLGLRSADQFVDTGQPNELERIILANTLLGRLAPRGMADLSLAAARDRTRAELALLPSLAERSDARPRFVFMHLPVPHWPYAFAGDCSPVRSDAAATSRDDPGDRGLAALVRAQTECVDSLLAPSLAQLTQEDPDAVIVLLSDHGPQEYLDKEAPTDIGLRKRSSILFAARTPGHPELFPDDITLVNVLPTLLNAYLGTDLPLHPDRIWLGPRGSDSSFVPVTWTRPDLPCLPGACSAAAVRP